ncbi:MAG: hypothetical protein HRT57_04760 [Crocinitomicaceae bacterium]|nr:hypothetical protein [Crocinitomicaceae bacterium]
MRNRFNVLIMMVLLLTLVLGSCGSSNNVVSNRLIQKRKYNKGWHINHSKKSKGEAARAADRESTDDQPEIKVKDHPKSVVKKAPVNEAQTETKERTSEPENELNEVTPISPDPQLDDENPMERKKSNKDAESEEDNLKESEGNKIPSLMNSFEQGPIFIYILAGFALVLVIASIFFLLIIDGWFYLLIGFFALLMGIVFAIWAMYLVLRDQGDTAPYSLIMSILAFIGGVTAGIILFLGL